MSKVSGLSALVVAHAEAAQLADCLERVAFAATHAPMTLTSLPERFAP